MDRKTQCGDRRCILESAGPFVRLYRDGRVVFIDTLNKQEIDDLDPRYTRVKTELDEMYEVASGFKKTTKRLWYEFKATMQILRYRLSRKNHNRLANNRR
jgi:hypothetical protein